MIKEISDLRKTVFLKIPQSEYKIVSSLMQEGRVISKIYEENNIIMEVEIPKKLEKSVSEFLYEKKGNT